MLQVVAITHSEKKGRTSFKGCVHYVGSNAFGGRIQKWGTYSVTDNGDILSSPQEGLLCCYGRGEQTDVTAEVKKAISQGDGR